MIILAVCASVSILGCPQQKVAQSVNPDGKVEFENLTPTVQTKAITSAVDDTESNAWSGGKGIILSSTKNNEYIAYEIPVDDGIARNVVFQGLKSPEFGRYRIAINERPTGKTIEFYGSKGIKTGHIDLGTFEPKNDKIRIVFALVGSNPKSRGQRFGAGLDYMLITKVTE